MTHHSSSGSGPQHPLVVNFLNAVRYYEFLQRHRPQAWANLERSVHCPSVPAIFRADFAFYHGQYRDAHLLLGNVSTWGLTIKNIPICRSTFFGYFIDFSST